MATSEERWLYRAEAFAFAMSITRPTPTSLTFGSALPSIGGRVEGTSNSAKHHLASFDNSFWSVQGTPERSRIYVTAASTEIFGLRILDKLEVSRLSVQAVGTYDAEHAQSKYPQVMPQRFEVQGLMIGGRQVETWHPQLEGDALAELAATNEGRRIAVDDFGIVYYHYVRLNGHEAELTALRVELGSPIGGIIIAGSVRVDGNWYP